MSVSDTAPDRLLFELYEYVPIEHPEQQDDGLAADMSRLRTGLARKRVYEVPKPLHLALHQRENIVLAHVEEKSSVGRHIPLRTSMKSVYEVLKKSMAKSSLFSLSTANMWGITTTRSSFDTLRLTEKISNTALPPVQTPTKPSER